MRKLRSISEGGVLVEVTTRTLPGRYLLKPSPPLDEIGRDGRRGPADRGTDPGEAVLDG